MFQPIRTYHVIVSTYSTTVPWSRDESRLSIHIMWSIPQSRDVQSRKLKMIKYSVRDRFDLLTWFKERRTSFRNVSLFFNMHSVPQGARMISFQNGNGQFGQSKHWPILYVPPPPTRSSLAQCINSPSYVDLVLFPSVNPCSVDLIVLCKY